MKRQRTPKARRPTAWSRVIREFLDEKGWHQNDLAREAHVDPNTVSAWMTGESEPVKALPRLANAMGLDPHQLLKRVEHAHQDGLTTRQRQLLEIYDVLDEDERDLLARMAIYLAKGRRFGDHPFRPTGTKG